MNEKQKDFVSNMSGLVITLAVLVSLVICIGGVAFSSWLTSWIINNVFKSF